MDLGWIQLWENPPNILNQFWNLWFPEFQNCFKLVSWDVLGLDPPWIHTDPAISGRQTPKTWLFPVFGLIWDVFDRFWALEVPKFQNEA